MGYFMLRFKITELAYRKGVAEGREITWKEIGEKTGISAGVISNLASPRGGAATNTRYLESLCRYFKVSVDSLVEFTPPVEEDIPCDVDHLYPK